MENKLKEAGNGPFLKNLLILLLQHIHGNIPYMFDYILADRVVLLLLLESSMEMLTQDQLCML